MIDSKIEHHVQCEQTVRPVHSQTLEGGKVEVETVRVSMVEREAASMVETVSVLMVE